MSQIRQHSLLLWDFLETSLCFRCLSVHLCALCITPLKLLSFNPLTCIASSLLHFTY